MHTQRRSGWLFLGALLAFGCGPAVSQAPLTSSKGSEVDDAPHSNRTAQPNAAPGEAAVSATAPDAERPASAASPAVAPTPPLPEPERETKGASGSVRVVLLDAGREPRKKLRFTYHEKEVLKLRVRSEGSIELEMKDKVFRQPIPSMEFEGTIQTLKVDGEGSAHRQCAYSGVRILPTPGVERAIEDKVAAMLQGFAGVTVRDVVSNRGESLQQDFDFRSVSSPELKQMFEGMAGNMPQSPWPEEAIGPGARWRTRSVKTVHGVSAATDTQVTLRTLSGKRAEL